MAIRLLNMGFSMQSQDYLDGNFEPYAISNLPFACSCSWYLYTGSGLTLHDKAYFLTQSLTPSDWSFIGNDTSDLDMVPGDYVLVRIYPGDTSPPANCKLRFTMVVGRGHDHSHDSHAHHQSPFEFQQGTQVTARPVIDSDDSNAASWPVSPTGNNIWTFCAGKLHNHVARYSLSVGATIYNPVTQILGVYGDDPTIHVKGTGGMGYVAA